jgi:uncharacterized protein YcfJ
MLCQSRHCATALCLLSGGDIGHELRAGMIAGEVFLKLQRACTPVTVHSDSRFFVMASVGRSSRWVLKRSLEGQG